MRISVAGYVESLHDLERSARDLTAGMTPAQLSWRPDGGRRWSIADCLQHLAVANTIYLDAMQERLSRADAAGGEDFIETAGWPSARFVRDLEPPPRYKLRAPSKIVPQPVPDGASAVDAFVASSQRALDFNQAARNAKINSIRFRNPLLPILRFTIGTGLLVIAAHSRRHLWQAQQVKNDAGFPA